MASSGDTMGSGTEKDHAHWWFVSVQTRGCLSATRRSDKQREQQRQLAGYLAMRECEAVGMGDTRLGGDASGIARLTQTALNGLYTDDTSTEASDEAAGLAGRVQNRPDAAMHDNDTNMARLSPLPCKAAAPKGPAFCFLNYYTRYKTRARSRWARRRGRHGPLPARTLPHVTNSLTATTTSTTDGAQARDGAPVVNMRKLLGPTLGDWVVRKHVRKRPAEPGAASQ